MSQNTKSDRKESATGTIHPCADQQRRLTALLPELEEGQRREEELVAKLQAVEQDSKVSLTCPLVQVFLSSCLKGVDEGVIP